MPGPGLLGLPPIDPSQIPLATQNPMPQGSGPGLLGRALHGMGNFFHPYQVDPAYSGMLDPEEQAYLKSQAQRQLGANLLQASGPTPQGTQNFGSRLGAAMGAVPWQQMQQGAAQNIMGLWQAQYQIGQRQRRQQIMQDVMRGLGPNASRADIAQALARAIPRLIGIGDEEGVGHMGELMRTLNPEMDPANIELKQETDPGSGQSSYVPYSKITGRRVGIPQTATPGATVPTEQWDKMQGRASELGAKYRTEIKPFADDAAHMREAKALVEQARTAGDPIAQSGLMAAAATAMQGGEPGGARGEALLNLIDRSKPLYAKVRGLVQNVTGKSPLLTPDEINAIGSLIQARHNSVVGKWGRARQSYLDQARGAKIPDAMLGGLFQMPDAQLGGPVTPSIGPAKAKVLGTLGIH